MTSPETQAPQTDQEKLLVRFFSALDTSVNLYYALHVNDPAITVLIPQVRSLTNTEFNHAFVAQILAIYPSAYRIQVNSRGSMTIGVDCNLKMQLRARSIEFEERLAAYMLANGSLPMIEDPQSWISKLAEVKPREELPTKRAIDSAPNASLKKAKILSNSPSKFAYKAVSTDTTGLTLLERIKLKAKLKAEQVQVEQTPEIKRKKYLAGKFPVVYDILYTSTSKSSNSISFYAESGELGETAALTKCFPLVRMTEIIKDSIKHALPDDDVKDILLEIAAVLENVEMVPITTDKEETYAVKVGTLNRNADLKKLKELET
ncbi:hypothetical protein BABINDRAFT_163209 [Babjeviella inositovora NRRL Y-12698]|uniref:DNA replication factor Cdt1 C-terminal domain-containing protein n=1 Tax=Babjeviella inositovora NRRL Y-12698 TaxID=984486 RepID=A0A1E3QL58_9ASCO|nr:uncharacterized protein BABINDRAFT_163209 [Babjeviella inositovora NRRL Y-12698]ODQ77822.1 hypothetical protein BABINDRAFT_163209 [Babjeviella inositovora NRRL Y-12698]